MLINAHLDWKHTVYYTAEESHTNLLHPKASGIHLFFFSLWLFPSFLCCIKHLSHQCVSPLCEVERNPHSTQSRSSTLPNKPGRDSLADSCSRWHYYSALSQSSGPGSSTGRGGGPFALPAHQYQHQHMAVLYNTVSAGWYVSVIIQQVLFLSFFLFISVAGSIVVQGPLPCSAVFMYTDETHWRWQSVVLKVKGEKTSMLSAPLAWKQPEAYTWKAQNWFSLKVQSVHDVYTRWYADCAFIKTHGSLTLAAASFSLVQFTPSLSFISTMFLIALGCLRATEHDSSKSFECVLIKLCRGVE